MPLSFESSANPAHGEYLMPIFLKSGFRCLFIHIPKTGGTSVEHSLRRLGWTDSLILHQDVRSIGYLKVSPQHYHASILQQIIRPEQFDLIFTICRHPFSRLKSEYYWQRDLGLTRNTNPSEWIRDRLSVLSQDCSAFDNHMRPQTEFIPEGWNCQILKLEENGVDRAVAQVDALCPAHVLRRWARGTFPARLHQSRLSQVLETSFELHRKNIEEFYRLDMIRFGY